MTAKRYDNVDIIKAFGIILMVCGHCNAPFTGWLYMFHMAVFFIASGYCWNSYNANDFTSVKKYIIKKIKTLYIPYVAVNSVFAVLSNFFIKINIYTADEAYIDLVTGGFVAERSIRDILFYIKSAVLFNRGEPMGGATWFIGTLFIISVFHCVLCYCINKISNKKIKNVFIAVIAVIIIAGAELVKCGDLVLPFRQVTQAFFAGYIIYVIGIIIRKKDFIKICSEKIKIPLMVVMMLFIAVLQKYGNISMAIGGYVNLLFYIAVSVSGWIMLYCAADIISENEKIKNVMVYVGKNTMPIVFYHFIAFKPVSAIYLAANNLDIELTATFPVLNNTPAYMWIIYTVAGVIIPLAVNYLYKKYFVYKRMEKNI